MTGTPATALPEESVSVACRSVANAVPTSVDCGVVVSTGFKVSGALLVLESEKTAGVETPGAEAVSW